MLPLTPEKLLSLGITPRGASQSATQLATWTEEAFIAPENGFTLAHAPIEGSLVVFRNRGFEGGWTLAGTTLTLTEVLSGGDQILCHYQYAPE